MCRQVLSLLLLQSCQFIICEANFSKVLALCDQARRVSYDSMGVDSMGAHVNLLGPHVDPYEQSSGPNLSFAEGVRWRSSA